MHRRKYLSIVGIGVAVAGCSDSGTQDAESTDESVDEDTEESTGGGGADENTPTDDGEEDGTEEESTEEPEGGTPDVVLGEPELVIEEGDYSTDVYVKLDVENVGDAPTGWVNLDVRWFNEAGDFLDDRTGRLYTLGAGETWAARVYHLGSGSEEVSDFELEGEFRELPSPPPETIELIESELQVGDRSADILGRIENGTGEELPYLQAIGKIYDGDGVVLGTARTNQTDIPADSTWRFDMSWRGRDRVDLAEDYEIVLADTVF